ncbi:MAG TPA: HisA/HisF-related TIM barrel protein, partial [Solirubrobacteraceae bacterium]|nr:HisA/HisF-related TIM barrel protein [Solirubrobacteraceae bacterium]
MIPTLLLKDHGLVKGVGFDSWRRVGTLPPAVRVYNTRDVDELIVLDIAATPASRTPSFEEVEDVAPGCRVPLTVGGGIRTIDDVAAALRAGADKISVNTIAFSDMSVVTETAARFGSQCVVASIDARWDPTAERHVCYSHSDQRREDVAARDWAQRLEAA